jgi:hypothetical protein
MSYGRILDSIGLYIVRSSRGVNSSNAGNVYDACQRPEVFGEIEVSSN